MKNVPFETDKYYHIYNRGNNREKIFIEEENYNYFLNLITKYLLPILDVYSFCLLPNHFHLIIKMKETKFLPQDIKLHQSFSNLFNAYTKAINKKYNRRGSLFQEHLKRIEIKNTKYLQSLIVYVNTNSIHHEIADYKNYPFSSFKALISDKNTHLKRNQVIKLFDSVENFKYMLENKKMNLEVIQNLVFE